jgi:hypothetical protein
LFSEADQDDAEQLIITLYLMIETFKGRKSRWFPFLSILNPVDEATNEPVEGAEQSFFCDWDPEVIEQCQDPILMNAAKSFAVDIDLQWDLMRAFLLENHQTFGPMVEEWKSLFKKCYALVCTTCFSDEIDRTILAPFAHCLNHTHRADTISFTINKTLHLEPLRIRSYYEGPKYLTDVRPLYENDTVQIDMDSDLVKGFSPSKDFDEYRD